MDKPQSSRDLIYVGSSKKDATKLPKDVQEVFAAALKIALNGGTHEDAKPFKYHGSGVVEVVCDYNGDTFREIYTVQYKEVVFVIHIFQKKSKKGSETPRPDKDLIAQRLKWATQLYKELYGKKTK